MINIELKFRQFVIVAIIGLVSLIFTMGIFVYSASANNLSITEFGNSAIDTSADTITFQIDLSWDNSWRNATNYDAVWMFIKYSTDAGVNWSHATLAATGTDPTGFTVPSGFEVKVPTDAKGFFVQRDTIGSGTSTVSNLKVVWDYGADSVTDAQAQATATRMKIFGIEMVYIPQGAFYAGNDSFLAVITAEFTQGSVDGDAWYIQSENPINTTNCTDASCSATNYYYTSTGASAENSTGDIFLIPASFPKGYDAFYLMKYELTEGQWVDFFNNLPYDSSNASKDNHDITSSTEGGKNSDACVNRNTVSWDGNETHQAFTLRPDRPVSYVSWPDVCAFADWAALRPITELEFEKAARGKDVAPVSNEWAWGTSSGSLPGAGEITPDADEDGDETISDSTANINLNQVNFTTGDGRGGAICTNQMGPLRAGIFAESGTTRTTSGAGYYGNMELSGSLAEPVVTVGRTEGRIFTGSHGDGTLSSTGYATNADWPGYTGGNVSGTVGAGYRGGDFYVLSSDPYDSLVADRTWAAKDPDSEGKDQRWDTDQDVWHGGRLGRTAP